MDEETKARFAEIEVSLAAIKLLLQEISDRDASLGPTVMETAERTSERMNTANPDWWHVEIRARIVAEIARITRYAPPGGVAPG